MKKNVKKRNWAFVVYPESAPENWRDILAQKGVVAAISPLHDKDLTDTGEVKKAHHHVIVTYQGPTSYNVVKALCDELNQPIPQPLESVKGYYRYFTHKDNPDKAQYDESDIETIGGFDIRDFVELTRTEVEALKRDLQSKIREWDIYEYSDLMDILLDSDLTDLYDIASNHTYFFTKYIDSRRNKMSCRDKKDNT